MMLLLLPRSHWQDTVCSHSYSRLCLLFPLVGNSVTHGVLQHMARFYSLGNELVCLCTQQVEEQGRFPCTTALCGSGGELQNGISGIWFRSPANHFHADLTPRVPQFSLLQVGINVAWGRSFFAETRRSKKCSWHLTLGTAINLLPLSFLKRAVRTFSTDFCSWGWCSGTSPSWSFSPCWRIWINSPFHSLVEVPEEILPGF